MHSALLHIKRMRLLLMLAIFWFPCLAFTNYRIYTVGTSVDRTSALLWIYDLNTSTTQQITLATAPTAAISYGVVVADASVYIAGYLNSYDISSAVLWITDLNGSNIQQVTLATGADSSNASLGVAVSGKTIYSVGSSGPDGSAPNAFPTLWITDVDTYATRAILLENTQGNGADCTKATVSGGHVYITGTQNTLTSGSNLWITDLDGNITTNEPLDTTIGAISYGVAASSSSVYVANARGISDLYITDLNGSNIKSKSLNGATNLYAVALSSSSVYVVGNGGTNALLWVTDFEGNQLYGPTALPSGATASAVIASNTSVYSVGLNDTQKAAVLWISNFTGSTIRTVALGSGLANGVAFAPVSGPSDDSALEREAKLYCPLVPLRGLGW